MPRSKIRCHDEKSGAAPSRHETDVRQDVTWINNGVDCLCAEHLRKIAEATGMPVQISRNDINLKDSLSEAAASWEAAQGFCGCILLKNSCVTRACAFHEILHIWRWFAQDIPILEMENATKGERSIPKEFITGLENQLEHCFVIPETIKHYSEERIFWEKEEKKKLQSLGERLSNQTPESRRFNIAILKLKESFYGSAVIASEMRLFAKTHGVSDEFENFGAILKNHTMLTDEAKRCLARAIIEFAGYDTSGVSLKYVNKKNSPLLL